MSKDIGDLSQSLGKTSIIEGTLVDIEQDDDQRASATSTTPQVQSPPIAQSANIDTET
jgi:hypothetical protein